GRAAGNAHDRDARLRLPSPAEVVGNAHRPGRVAGHGVDPAGGCTRTARENRERSRSEAIEPIVDGHRLTGVGIVAEAGPVAVALDLLVGNGSLDDHHEWGALAARRAR